MKKSKFKIGDLVQYKDKECDGGYFTGYVVSISSKITDDNMIEFHYTLYDDEMNYHGYAKQKDLIHISHWPDGLDRLNDIGYFDEKPKYTFYEWK